MATAVKFPPRTGRVTPGEFTAYVAERGYKVEPITNSIEAAQEGADLVIMGYRLIGPRNNRTTVGRDADGTYDIGAASLWADGVDYATAQIAARRASARR